MRDRDSQTEFMNEEPLFESSQLPEAPEPVEPPQKEDPSKSRIMMIGGIAFVLILFINIVGIVILMSNTDEPENVQELAIDKQRQMVSPGAWQAELSRLRSYLEEIEPEREYLPRPPVDYDIRLEAAQRR